MTRHMRRARNAAWGWPMPADERREPAARGPYIAWRMEPPPDGPELTPEQIETCRRGVSTSLEAGAWDVAVACVERSRGGVKLLATREQLDRLRDGPKCSPPVAESLSRIVAVWLAKATVSSAITALSKRRRDMDFIGDPLSGNDPIEDLGLRKSVRDEVKRGGQKTLADLATRLELWARFPQTTPKSLQREWHEISRMMNNAGLLGPLATARMNSSGRNSKARKEKT